jgi:hypothetical protein
MRQDRKAQYYIEVIPCEATHGTKQARFLDQSTELVNHGTLPNRPQELPELQAAMKYLSPLEFILLRL